MKFILYAALFVVVSTAFIILIFTLVSKYAPKYEEATKNTRNIDGLRIGFYYKVPMSRSELLLKLSVPSVYDEFKYELNNTSMVMTATYFTTSVDFQLTIIENPEGSILAVEQIPFLTGKTPIFSHMNPFWSRKVDAVPVRYSEIKNSLINL